MSLPPFLAFLEQTDPEFARAIEKVSTTAMGPGALDQRTKLLIALAVDAAHGSVEGAASLSKQLKALGASDSEIAEALRIAYFAAGNSILFSFKAALNPSEEV